MRESHKAVFERLREDGFVERARHYARWTLPQLMALTDERPSDVMENVERDYQEVGPLLVNNLAAKLAGILFPISHPFFKAELPATMKSVALEVLQSSETELNARLAQIELAACQQLFKNASYAQLVLALKHLIVTGNVLLFRDSSREQTLAYGLGQFGIRRDTRGAMLDCVLREYTYFDALEPPVQQQLLAKNRGKYLRAFKGEQALRVELYTRIRRMHTRKGGVVYEASQEVDDIPVGKPGSYPAHLCPWQAPVWTLIPGEHYGRGLVEDYAGGFAKMSELAHAGLLYDVNMMRVVNLASPGSGADVDTIATKETGEWAVGDPAAVQAFEAGDARKSAQVHANMEATFTNLARAFMYTGNTRDAERVTAFELRQQAQEAEATLGGTYSALAAGLQVPMAGVLIAEAAPETQPALATGILQLSISAGIPALGRTNEVYSILGAVQDGAAAITLAQLDRRIDPAALMDTVYAGHSVNTQALFKSPEQMREEAEADAQEAAAQQSLMAGAEIAAASDAIQKLPS